MKDLTEQVAIITGASSGIGAAVARNLHDAGMKVVITARRAERLQQLAADLGGAVAVPGDLTDPALPQHLIDVALDQFGRCDVIFNNAGIMEAGPIDEVDIDRICHMVRINVEGTFRMAYVAVKYFKSIDRGYLINVSSILGTKVRPTAGAYAGTKYAIEALTETLRMELAKTNVKVSVLEPSLTRTELHDHWQVHPVEALNIQHPLEPADIARTVRWMLQQPDHVVISNILVMPKEQEL